MTLRERLLWHEHRTRQVLRKAFGAHPVLYDSMDDKVPSGYVRAFIRPQNEALRRITERLGAVSYLDVGTGNGRFIDIAKDTARDIVTIDINGQSLHEAGKKYLAEISQGKLRVLKADVRSIPLESGSVDVVVCNANTLGAYFFDEKGVEYHSQAIREMLRVAAKEVVFTLHSENMLRESLRYCRMNGIETSAIEDGRIVGPSFSSRKFSRDDLDALMAESGIPAGKYDITAINSYGWLVRIRK